MKRGTRPDGGRGAFQVAAEREKNGSGDPPLQNDGRNAGQNAGLWKS